MWPSHKNKMLSVCSETIPPPLTLLVMNNSEDQRGSPSATEEVQLLFVRHEHSIRAFVRALQPSLADADDVLRDFFDSFAESFHL